jgi:DNA-directed RNA polymerase subunit E'/Rpb7
MPTLSRGCLDAVPPSVFLVQNVPDEFKFNDDREIMEDDQGQTTIEPNRAVRVKIIGVRTDARDIVRSFSPGHVYF